MEETETEEKITIGEISRRDSRPSSVDTMDLGLARKPVRDVKSKEKDKEKEREREEKKTQDRRSSQGGNRPNQGRRPNQRLPKALETG